MAKRLEVYYNDSKLTREDSIKILKAARVELITKVFQIQANNNIIPYITNFDFGDAEIQTLELPGTPQDFARKFIALLLNKENIVECVNTLCNLDQFNLDNYRNLIVGILSKYVEIREVTKVDQEEKQEEKKNQKENKEEISNEKLENLVVGDPDCTFNEVCDTLSKCESTKALWKNLMAVADGLDIPSEVEISIERGLKNDTKMHSSALREILESWRGKHSRNAKLLTLVEVLKAKDLGGCADALLEKFKA